MAALAVACACATAAHAQDAAEEVWTKWEGDGWSFATPSSWEPYDFVTNAEGEAVKIPYRALPDASGRPKLPYGWTLRGPGAEEGEVLVGSDDMGAADEATTRLVDVSARLGAADERAAIVWIAGRRCVRAHVPPSEGAPWHRIVWRVPARPRALRVTLRGSGACVDGHIAAIDSVLRSTVWFDAPPPVGEFWKALALLGGACGLVGLGIVVRGVRRDLREARARGDEPLHEVVRSDTAPALATDCPNCGATLTGPFCAACGQRRIAGRLDLRQVVSDWLAKVLDLEAGFLGTVTGLTLHPVRVVREVLSGRRAAYCSPVRYFTTWVVIDALAHVPLNSVYESDADTMVEIVETVGRVDLEPWTDQIQSILQWTSAGFVVLVGAWLGLRLFRRAGLRYAEHLVVTLYAAGHAYALSALLALVEWLAPSDVLTLIREGSYSMLWALAIFAAFHARVHGRWGAVWRTAVCCAGLAFLALVGILAAGLSMAAASEF